MNKFYVYAHAKPDGEVFYVGKGSGKRLFTTGNRSSLWKRIVSKYGYTAIILEECLTEQDSYEREVYFISYYKSIGQCVANFTLGGDGVNVENRWWGNKISASLKGKKCASGIDSKSYKDFMPESTLRKLYLDDGLSTTKISHLCGVSYGTVWSRLKSLGIATRPKGRAKRKVFCVTDNLEFNSITDAARHYCLFRENIGKVLAGKYKHTGNKVFSYIKGDKNGA